ncbi:Ig-like domain-containing protein, partial [Janthinobacterium aquaticum]|uniref:Ig-like domain-containing protein n=1 Tax=Janthinobacterium sp. FT58W TaxID=2654254 RepID=UPI00139EEB48
AAPSAPVLALASDSGNSSTDGVTNVTTPTVTGTAEAGSTVTLYDTNGTTVLGTAVATGGVWSITSSALASGTHNLSVKAVDAAGNSSVASASLSITIDTTAPAAPSAPVLTAASDNGSSNTDGITNVTTPTVTGTAEAGSTVTLYDTDGTTVLGTTTATGGVWSITSSALADGAHSLSVKAVDASGNRSAASPSLTITIVSAAPAAPGAPVLALASDSGSSNTDGVTNVTTPTVTGTAEAGSTVTLYDTNGTTVLGTAVATGGVWSITSSALASGTHSLSVKAVDAAGNSSVASAALSINIDSAAPAAPSAPVLALASDSGVSNTDGVTNVTTPTVTGTAEAGSTVTLYDTNGTTVLGTAVATGGTWSITSSALASGTHSLSVKAVDAAGNRSAASPSLTITIVSTAPAAPGAPILALASDSGSSNTDGVTNVTTPTVTGTAEAGSTITLYDTDGTTVLGTTTATGGVWSITSSALASGTHSLSVKAVDTAGNPSVSSAALTITVDTTAPAAPAAPVLAAASDSGASNTDGITSITRPTITGRAEAGSTVSLYDTDGVTVLGTVLAAANGNWSITSSTLADGVHSLSVRATDSAGNRSAASPALTVTIDTAVPATPAVPVLAAASDNGASNSDGITSVTRPTVSGRALPGATVTLYDTDGVSVLGSAVVGAGGDWSITSSTLADGNHQLTVKTTSTSGLVSAASTALVVTIDTTAPAAPATPVLSPASDNGASNSDAITSVTRPTITGTAEAGSTVTLYDTDGVTVLGTAVVAGNGSWSMTSSVLAEGSHALSVKATDAAGNTSAASAALQIVIDTAAPAAPATPVLSSASDNGTSNSDAITSVTRPTITGTAEAGSTVTLYDTDGVTVLGTAVVAGNGSWSMTSSVLAGGSHALSVKATDAAGNTSAASAALQIVIDTAAPAAPATPVLSSASDNGTSNSDGITSITRPTITGTAEAGSAVTLYDTDGVTVLGTAVVAGNGSWSITSSVLAEGSHTLSVKATDAAGNTSASSPALTVTIDTTAPATPAVPVLSPASDNGVSNSDGITSVARPTINGRAEAGSMVTLYDTDGVTVLGTTTADAVGAWSITSSLLADGSHLLSVRITDAGGNTSSASAALTVMIDTSAPAAPATPLLAPGSDNGASNSDGITSVSRPTITGRAEAGSIVTLFDTDGVTVLGSTVAAVNGSWNITSSVLGDGTHSLTVRATDAAGNRSAASAALTVTIDTGAPAAPSVPALTAASDNGVSGSDGITSVRTPTVTGTAENGSTVTLYDSNGTTVLGTAVAVNGSWRITSSTLSEGTHTLTVRATDTAGNTSTVSAPLTVVIDTTAPAVAGTPKLPGGEASTLDTLPSLTGTAEASSTVTVRSNGTVIGTVQADANGTWTLTAQLSLGNHQITATATDAAGNTGATSAAFSLTVLAPPAPAVTAPLPPAPPVLAPVAEQAPPATPPVRDAAQGQVSQSALAAAVQGAVQGTMQTPAPQTATITTPAPRVENVSAPLPQTTSSLVVNKEISSIALQTGTLLNFTVPADTFTSSSGGTPTLSARLADGSELPSWLSFNPATGTFTGSPPPGQAGLLEIEVLARDANGNEARTVFKIETAAPAPAPVPQASLTGKELLMALGLHKRVAQIGQPDTAPDGDAVPADSALAAVSDSAEAATEAEAVPASALSGQLSQEAQRFAREAQATLRHLAQI